MIEKKKFVLFVAKEILSLIEIFLSKIIYKLFKNYYFYLLIQLITKLYN